MKKIFSVVFAFALILLLASCGKAAPAPEAFSPTPASTDVPASSAALPNPIVEVEDSTDFSDLGFIITPHQLADSVSYSIIGNTVAQIVFTLDGSTYTYRAAVADSDISGIYETFDALPRSLDLEGPGFKVSVLIRTIQGGEKGALAQWHYEDVQYSFYTPDRTDYEALTDVLLPIIYNDLPFAACCG